MSKSRNPLSPSRWEYIKQLALTERYFHVSAQCGMKPADPLWPNGPQVPWVQPGVTYRKPKEQANGN